METIIVNLLSADGRYNQLPNIRQPVSFGNSSSSRSSAGSLSNTGPLNYCTIRRPTGSSNMNQQRRAVQFADQHENRTGGQDEGVKNLFLRLDKIFPLCFTPRFL